MVMLRKWSVSWRENGHVTVGQCREGEWLCYRIGLTEGEWSCYSLMEGEWSCYRGGQFNRGSMVMLLRWPV